MAGGVLESGRADEVDWGKSARGGGHHLHSPASRVCLSGRNSGCPLTQGGGLGTGPDTGRAAGSRRIGGGDRKRVSRLPAWCITPTAECNMPATSTYGS